MRPDYRPKHQKLEVIRQKPSFSNKQYFFSQTIFTFELEHHQLQVQSQHPPLKKKILKRRSQAAEFSYQSSLVDQRPFNQSQQSKNKNLTLSQRDQLVKKKIEQEKVSKQELQKKRKYEQKETQKKNEMKEKLIKIPQQKWKKKFIQLEQLIKNQLNEIQKIEQRIQELEKKENRYEIKLSQIKQKPLSQYRIDIQKHINESLDGMRRQINESYEKIKKRSQKSSQYSLICEILNALIDEKKFKQILQDEQN